MARSSSPTGSKASTTGRTVTKKVAEGNVLQLEPGLPYSYLCAHICFAEKSPRLSKIGSKLKQRACTKAIWAEEEVNQLIWKYKAEVGYIMTQRPPVPIMSSKKGQELRPSRFPLGAANGMQLFKKTLEDSDAKGRLRIPDCIVLKISDDELRALRISGKGDIKKLLPIQSNIETVVEIKFGNDKLSREQIRDYKIIAGSNDKFRELRDTSCFCDLRNNTQTVDSKKYNYLDNALLNAMLQKQMEVKLQTDTPITQPIGDYLDKPLLGNILIGGAIIATVAVGIFVAPEIVAGALLLKVVTN